MLPLAPPASTFALAGACARLRSSLFGLRGEAAPPPAPPSAPPKNGEAAPSIVPRGVDAAPRGIAACFPAPAAAVQLPPNFGLRVASFADGVCWPAPPAAADAASCFGAAEGETRLASPLSKAAAGKDVAELAPALCPAPFFEANAEPASLGGTPLSAEEAASFPGPASATDPAGLRPSGPATSLREVPEAAEAALASPFGAFEPAPD